MNKKTVDKIKRASEYCLDTVIVWPGKWCPYGMKFHQRGDGGSLCPNLPMSVVRLYIYNNAQRMAADKKIDEVL